MHFETDLNDLSRKTEGPFQLADIKTMVDAVIMHTDLYYGPGTAP